MHRNKPNLIGLWKNKRSIAMIKYVTTISFFSVLNNHHYHPFLPVNVILFRRLVCKDSTNNSSFPQQSWQRAILLNSLSLTLDRKPHCQLHSQVVLVCKSTSLMCNDLVGHKWVSNKPRALSSPTVPLLIIALTVMVVVLVDYVEAWWEVLLN